MILTGLKLYFGYILGTFLVGTAFITLLFTVALITAFLQRKKR